MSDEVHTDDEQLVAVLLGTEPPPVRAHLGSCVSCQSRLQLWAGIRAGALAAGEAFHRPVPGTVLGGALMRIHALPPPVGERLCPDARLLRRVWLGWQLLTAQVPLVRRSLGAASALMLLLGVLVVVTGNLGQGGQLLALLAPPAAAVGLAMLYGPEVDPPLELTATTGTSPRTVLLARLVLVCAYDLALGVAATGVTLACGTDGGFLALVGTWLGPMLLLSALSLALSLLTGPAAGMGIALGLWALRLLAGVDTGGSALARTSVLSSGQAQVIREAWGTSLPVLVLGAVVLAAAVTAGPRRLGTAL